MSSLALTFPTAKGQSIREKDGVKSRRGALLLAAVSFLELMKVLMQHLSGKWLKRLFLAQKKTLCCGALNIISS